jgi:hypothetical protein
MSRVCQYNVDDGIEGVGLPPLLCGEPVPCSKHAWSWTSDPPRNPEQDSVEETNVV